MEASSSPRNARAMLEPQVSVARVSEDSHQDYEISKQMGGLEATQAVRSSLMGTTSATTTRSSTSGSSSASSLPPPPRRSSSGMEPSMVARVDRHDNYEAAKRESAVSLDPSMVPIPRNSHGSSRRSTRNSGIAAGRVSGISIAADAPMMDISEIEPSTVARVDRHDNYEAAKRESAVSLDPNMVPIPRNSHGSSRRSTRNSSIAAGRVSGISIAADGPMMDISEIEPSTVARVDRHDNYQAAKRESAVSLGAQNNNLPIPRNSHGSSRKSVRHSATAATAAGGLSRISIAGDAPIMDISEIEPSTVARVDRHDDYQAAKRESSVLLENQVKANLTRAAHRPSVNNHTNGLHTTNNNGSIMSSSASTLPTMRRASSQQQEPSAMVKLHETTAFMSDPRMDASAPAQINTTTRSSTRNSTTTTRGPRRTSSSGGDGLEPGAIVRGNAMDAEVGMTRAAQRTTSGDEMAAMIPNMRRASSQQAHGAEEHYTRSSIRNSTTTPRRTSSGDGIEPDVIVRGNAMDAEVEMTREPTRASSGDDMAALVATVRNGGDTAKAVPQRTSSGDGLEPPSMVKMQDGSAVAMRESTRRTYSGDGLEPDIAVQIPDEEIAVEGRRNARRTNSGDGLEPPSMVKMQDGSAVTGSARRTGSGDGLDSMSLAAVGLANNATMDSSRTSAVATGSRRGRMRASTSQIDADNQIKAGLRNARASVTTVGATSVRDVASRSTTPPKDRSQVDADARVKAGLRNSRMSASVVPGAMAVGAVSVMNGHNNQEIASTGSLTPPQLTQAESDARVKAGLRNARQSVSTPGAMSVGAISDVASTGSVTPPKLTQAESDARVKAGLRNARASMPNTSTMMVGAVSIPNSIPNSISQDGASTGSLTPPTMTQAESDARVKAGLRQSRMSTSGGAVVGAVDLTPPKMSQTDSDARIKAGLRNSRTASVVGATPVVLGTVVVAGAAVNQVEADAQIKAGLRKSSRPSVISETRSAVFETASASMDASTPEQDVRLKRGLRNSISPAAAGAVAVTPDVDARSGRGLRASNRASLTPGASPGRRLTEAEMAKFGGLRTTGSTPDRSVASSDDCVGSDDDMMAVKARYKTTGEESVGAHGGAVNQSLVLEKERLFGGVQSSLQESPADNTLPTPRSLYEDEPEQQPKPQPLVSNGDAARTVSYVQVVQPTDGHGGDIMEVEAGKGNVNRLWCILIFVVVIIIIVVAAVVGAASSPGEPTTEAPTGAPVQTEPPFIPVSVTFPTTTLPAVTVEAIESQSGRLPQVRAYNWLVNDPNLSEYVEAKRLQRFALATLYYSFQEAGGPLDDWLVYDSHECAWRSNANQEGFAVCQGFDAGYNRSSPFDHYDYITLMLSGNPNFNPSLNYELRGMLVPELALLTSLQRLDLGLQKLRGSIPSELGLLSSTLRDVVLYDNSLTGTVPSVLFGFVQNLWLSHNRFSRSTIPTSVGLNTNLKTAFLINCMLTGAMPPELFESKPNLSLLFLEQNQLEGSIPSAIGKATALSEFRIMENRVTGQIPSELGLLSQATKVWLDLNRMTGQIATEIGNMARLQSLSVGGNRLKGTLVSELAKLRQLRELKLSWPTVAADFRNRNLEGTIPIEYFVTPEPAGTDGDTRYLRRLQSDSGETSTSNVSTSSTDGAETKPTFPHLERFWLADTKITSSLPSELALLPNLQSIKMGENRQMALGTLPTEIGLLTKLVELDLAEDNLQSTIPSELGLLVQLQALTLQHNELTGEIPGELASLTRLQWFQVDGNVDLAGSVPDNLCRVEMRGIGCSNDNVQDSGETSVCGCECPSCS